jgi:hypothetical protein
VLILGALGACQAGGSVRSARVDFEDMTAARAPSGFSQTVTGKGVPPSWAVAHDSSAPSGVKVLAQTSRDETSFHFPLCLLEDFEARDVAVSVRWKTIGGRMNRSGGIVTRFQDEDHYYLVRFNSLEDNVNLYCYDTAGSRRQLDGSYHLRLTEEEWHTLRVEVRGNRFKAWYDGVLQFEAVDNTIAAAGRVGLWSKSDSLTYFDDFVVERLDESPVSRP